MIGWGPYQPDQNTLTQSSLVALNVIPIAQGYKSLPSVAAASDALGSDILAVYAAADNAANASVFAGTAAGLYKLSGTGWDDLTNTGGAYATLDGERWRFVLWGRHVIGTNYSDPPQVHTLGTAVEFADLAGTPPRARHIAVVRDFVVLGNLEDGVDGAVPYRVRWSALGDHEDWTASATTQSDFQDLLEGGAIQAMVGGEYGVIFMDNAIWRMTYAGSPVIFQFDCVERQRGTYAPDSVVALGGTVFYLGLDGFYRFDGQTSTPIGAERVDRYFWETVRHAHVHKVQAAIDPFSGVVMWMWPGPGSSGELNRALIYNWRADRWSEAEFSVACLARTITTAKTLEDLDAISSTLEGLPAPLDSPLWTGGKQLFSAGTLDRKLGHFTGPVLAGTMETQEVELGQDQRFAVTSVRPVIDGAASAQISVGTRRRLLDTVSYTSPVTANAAGECPVRSDSRYHRFRATFSGDWDFALGVDVRGAPSGMR